MNKGNVEYGPLSWYGTVIPEDHVDFVSANFRSNENRWLSNKISMEVIASIPVENGSEATERLSKLTCIVCNDRVLKEKTTTLFSDKSKISIIKEFDWLKEAINELNPIFPGIISKAYYYIPALTPVVPQITLNDKFETKLDNLHLIGESSGIKGLLQSAITGCAVAEGF
jgi:hypothetical protein